MFQFQCGAIDRAFEKAGTVSALAFQFQCGAIDRYLRVFLAPDQPKFQFQCGAIDSSICEAALTNSKYVSIPVWCD